VVILGLEEFLGGDGVGGFEELVVLHGLGNF
jgi:hypothetical protein